MKIFGLHISRTPPAEELVQTVEELRSLLSEARDREKKIADQKAVQDARLKQEQERADKKREEARRAAEKGRAKRALACLEQAQRYTVMLEEAATGFLSKSKKMELESIILSRLERSADLGYPVPEGKLANKIQYLRQATSGN